MSKCLKMSLYHLVHGRAVWVLLIIMIVAFTGLIAFTSFISSPEFLQMVSTAAEGEVEGLEVPPKTYESATSAFGSFILSGLVAMFVSIEAVLLTSADFDSGYVRNVFSARRGRAGYFGAKIAMIVILSAVFVAVGMVAAEVLRQMFGFTYENADSVLGILLWFVLATLTISAYASLAAAIVWLFRSKAAGIATAIVVASGVLESILLQLFSPLLSSLGPLAQVPEWLLSTQNSILGTGAAVLLASPFEAARVAAVALVVIGVCLLLGTTLASRRDV